ncbi:hypothetical protein ACA910_008198 [Epithemia clementina (nom. ined.)]
MALQQDNTIPAYEETTQEAGGSTDTVSTTPDKRFLSAITPARHLTTTRVKISSPPSFVLKPIPVWGPEGSTRKVVNQNFDALTAMHNALTRELADLNGLTVQQSAAVNIIVDKLNVLAGWVGIPSAEVKSPTLWLAAKEALTGLSSALDWLTGLQQSLFNLEHLRVDFQGQEHTLQGFEEQGKTLLMEVETLKRTVATLATPTPRLSLPFDTEQSCKLLF